MAQPEKFDRVLRNGCVGVTMLLSGFGTFCYVSFGDKTADLITSNLPPDNKMVVLMQVMSFRMTVQMMEFCIKNDGILYQK